MVIADPSITDFIINKEFSKFYEAGLASRFNSRKLEHNLNYYSDRLVLFLLSKKYQMLVSFTVNGQLKIIVTDNSDSKILEDLTYQLKSSSEFLDTYKNPVNKYFPIKP